jgi:hypothetical protein
MMIENNQFYQVSFDNNSLALLVQNYILAK